MEDKVKSYKDLNIWQKGMDLAGTSYKLSKTLPESERYGLISQIQRAAVSVPANIAEGWARKHTKEYIHFLHISLGSLAELETLLIISSNLGYTKERSEEQQTMSGTIRELQKMIYAVIKSLDRKIEKR